MSAVIHSSHRDAGAPKNHRHPIPRPDESRRDDVSAFLHFLVILLYQCGRAVFKTVKRRLVPDDGSISSCELEIISSSHKLMLPSSTFLSGKNVVMTGGSRGIGGALLSRIADLPPTHRPAKIVLVGRGEHVSSFESIREQLLGAGISVPRPFIADLARPEQVFRVADEIREHFNESGQRIDVFLGNAGIFESLPGASHAQSVVHVEAATDCAWDAQKAKDRAKVAFFASFLF